MTARGSKKAAATSKAPAAKKASAARAPAGAAQRARRVSLSSADRTSRNNRIAEKSRSTTSTSVTKFVKALVAAAESAVPGGVGGTTGESSSQAWHRAAFAYSRTVPELGSAKMYVGNCMAQITLRVARRNADGSVEQGAFLGDVSDEPDPDAPPDPNAPTPAIVEMASDIVATLRAPYGGQSELLRSCGEKMFLVGDLWLLPTDTVTGLALDACSSSELKKEGEGWVRNLGPGGKTEPIPETTVPQRVWRRDAEYAYLSTSSVQACLEVLEELVILTRLVRSAAIQRLALSGILAIADEFDDPIDDQGEGEQMNPLATDIIESGAKAIDDPSSAAAWLPYLLQGPLEAIKDGIKLIRFEGDDALHVVKRREALERFAQGVDLPVEAVLGHQQTTFANAAQISEDRFKIHIEPMIQMLCDAFTVLVLWPGLAALLGLTQDAVKANGYPPEILDVAVGYDASKLISRPDRTKDIIEIFKADKGQVTIRLAEIREAVGLDADEVPSDDETAKRIIAYRDASARESIKSEGDTSGEIEGDIQAPEDAIDAAGVTAAAAVALNVAERIAGALEVTVERAVQRIGSKLRTKVNGNEKQREAVNGAANKDIARILGPTVTGRLLATDNPAEADIAELTRQVARWAAEIGMEEPAGLAHDVALHAGIAIHDRLYGTESLSSDTLLSLVAKNAGTSTDAT